MFAASRIRRFGLLFGSSLLALAVAACSGTSQSPSGSPLTDAELASEALNAGLTAHVAGDLAGAAEQYQTCLDHEPTSKLCLYNLGLIAHTQGRLAEAENDYRLALATDPDYTPAIFNLAILRTEADAPEEAITLYRHYIELLPDDASGHMNLGMLLVATGDDDEGSEEIATALELDPTLQLPQTSPESSASAAPSESSEASPSATP